MSNKLLSVSFLLAVVAVWSGYLATADYKAARKAQSWDQENLKANDSGCPTAIYIAPRGRLELCE